MIILLQIFHLLFSKKPQISVYPTFLTEILRVKKQNLSIIFLLVLIPYFSVDKTIMDADQYLFNMKSKPQKEDQHFFDKQQSDIYEIITGKRKYNIQPFRQCDLQPHLIFKIKVPSSQQRYIPLHNLLTLSHFVNSPSQRLERAYARAIKQIMKEMEHKHENNDPQNLKIRFQQSIQQLNSNECQPNQQGITGKIKKAQLMDEEEERQEMQFNCLHKWTGTLDIFSLELNAIIYILQRECGFRLKSFIAYDKHTQSNNLYLILSLPTENLLRVANKYRIKKEVDYSAFDFYLNDPCSEDSRPLRLNSKFKSDQVNQAHQKQISRYFNLHQATFKTDELVEEQNLTDEMLQNFRSCTQQTQLAFEYMKYKIKDRCTVSEKAYLFEYNRRKINPGCFKRFSIIQKRKEYFSIIKEILPKYGFKVRQQPVVFKEFSLPDKESKGATFYNKLQNILLYKPLTVSSKGQLSLFLNMEKAKLSYLVIKKYFKINYLNKLGMEIFTLDDQFQKFGGEGDVSGGIDGQNLNKNWNTYSLFSNMKVVRNYLGQKVAYQALYINYFIAYFASISIPFSILYTLQKIFESQIWLYTSFIQSFVFSISFNIFMAYLKETQSQFIKNYCEDVGSPMFLNKFAGPYQRNILTDQPNQFIRQNGFGAILKNLLCLILIVIFLVIFGAIFHGFRMLLVQIYQPLSQYRVDKVFSVAHIICYFGYFIIQGIFRSLLLRKLIKIMVKLKNPPTDQQKRQYFDNFTFFYLIGIQMIAPFFLLILQPFQGTTCYANVCEYELVYFVYSRYIFILLQAVIKLFKLVFANYIKYKLQGIFKEEPQNQIFYQEKLASLLEKIVDNSKKKQHVESKMEEIINIHNYAIYCTLLPISPVIIFLTIFIDFINLRMGLLYNERRPVNRSQKIIRITKQLWYIYYLGIYMNSWTNIILLQFAELNMQDLIQTFAMSINYQAIFLIKFFLIIIYSLILQAVGHIFYELGLSLSGSQLKIRKDNKYYEYLISRGGMKMVLKNTEDLIPLRSLFRTFNPDKIPAEILEEQLYKEIVNSKDSETHFGDNQSAKDLLKSL